jgi:hypothetical protein
VDEFARSACQHNRWPLFHNSPPAALRSADVENLADDCGRYAGCPQDQFGVSILQAAGLDDFFASLPGFFQMGKTECASPCHGGSQEADCARPAITDTDRV